MSRRTRLVPLAALALLLATTAACGAGDSVEADGGSDPLQIGVSFYNENLPLYVQMKQGMEQYAEEHDVEVLFADAENNASTQTDQINTYITRGVDAIIASPVDANALIPAYRQANSAKIPIFSVGNRLSDESVEAAYIGPDLAEQATRTMDRLIELMGGTGHILAITGPPQIAFVQLQEQGWKVALEKARGVRVVQTLVDPDLSKAGALDQALAGLRSNPGVTGIIASNEQVALGAIQAVDELGLDHDSIAIVGWNAPPEAVDAVRAGTYDVTLSQKAITWGQASMKTVVAWLDGDKPVGHRINTPDVFLDAENVGELTPQDLQ
jgi:ABC-type sugar transport system substrate-binding protein